MHPNAILNPELTYSLDAKQTAIGVSDIMAHIFERYFTTVGNVVSLTDSQKLPLLQL